MEAIKIRSHAIAINVMTQPGREVQVWFTCAGVTDYKKWQRV